MIDIRTAGVKDIPKILELYAVRDIDDNEVPDLATAEGYFLEMRGYPDYWIYLCSLDGTVVGTFSLLIVRNLAHMGAKSGIIEDVVVLDAYRSRGIGRAMMRFAIGKCREGGCYKVSLSSNIKRERAHEFYRNIGFRQHGISFSMDLE